MISLERAHAIIKRHAKPLKTETVYFLDAWHRVLAAAIQSPFALPSFDRATVDGFAVRSQDIAAAGRNKGVSLRVTATVAAGRPSSQRLKAGQAIKIMTGGSLPAGADCVVRKEDTQNDPPDVVKIYAAAHRGCGISFKGQDAKKNQVVLKKGTYLTPAAVSLLASMGVPDVPVFCRPKVAILVTGDELIDVRQRMERAVQFQGDHNGKQSASQGPESKERTPAFGKIFSSNQYGLHGQILEAGALPVLLGIARDNKDEIRSFLERGCLYDVLLISGGVSVGDFDLVPQVMRQCGAKIHFYKVAVQPGKPLIFGQKEDTLIFGLPGNPVSTMVAFFEFVRPALWRLQGRRDPQSPWLTAFLAQDLKLPLERKKIFRGILSLDKGKVWVRLAGHQGSGNVLSLVEADCLFYIEAGIQKIKKGSPVLARILS